MSLQDTIDTIKQIVDKIENATLLEQEESVIYNIVPNTANKEGEKYKIAHPQI